MLKPSPRLIVRLRFVLAGLAVLWAPGYFVGWVLLLTHANPWRAPDHNHSAVFYALKAAVVTPLESAVMGAQLGAVFTLPSLLIWWLLSRLGKTSWPWLVGVGIADGVAVKLALWSELPLDWTFDVVAAGALTGLLIWAIAYAGRPATSAKLPKPGAGPGVSASPSSS